MKQKFFLPILLVLSLVLIVQSTFALEQSFQQKLDHKSSTDTRTFRQRYFFYDEFAKGPNAPLFVFIGHERKIEDNYLNKSQLRKWAERLGAYVLAVEHRYYGGSSPFDTLEPENLKYLSWEQDLEDVAAIQKSVAAQYGIKGPAIAFGYSYGASMATFYRTRYPNLVVGAVAFSEVNLFLANSKKWQPKFDAPQREEFVAGLVEQKCRAKLVEMQNILENKYNNNDLQSLKNDFGAPQASNIDFLAALGDLTLVLAQEDADELCKVLLAATDSKDLFEKYKAFGTESLKKFEVSISEFALSLGSQELSMEAPANKFSGSRQFQYQHCSQTNQPFIAASKNREVTVTPIQVNKDYQSDFCRKHFDIRKPFQTNPLADRLIQSMLTSSSSGIAIINGAKDHWMLGSVLSMQDRFKKRLSKNNLYIVVKNGFHCPGADYIAEAKTDEQVEALVAQMRVFSFIKDLIARSPNNK